jgi:hypothetical protein
MNHAPTNRDQDADPGSCGHRKFHRVGIQRAPVPPFRLYLLTCRDCGTTLATQTLRGRRENAPGNGSPEPALEEDEAVS